MKYFVANWKENKDSVQGVKFMDELLANLSPSISNTEIIIAPQTISIETMERHIESRRYPIELAMQDLFYLDSGNMTGVTSPESASHSVKYTILGHSSRRQFLGETDEIVNKKVKAALRNNIMPIVCIGEDVATRSSNMTNSFIQTQLYTCLQGVNKSDFSKVIITYEPIWAISTNQNGEVATPDVVNSTINFIKDTLARSFGPETNNISYIYGGSVTSLEVAGFMDLPLIDGVLVGSASLDPEEFAKIIDYGYNKQHKN